MSHKVHVKSLRTNIWQNSNNVFYSEGSEMNSNWGKILFYNSYLYSLYQKGLFLKVARRSVQRRKKTIKKLSFYRISQLVLRMSRNYLYAVPVLSTYPRKGYSIKYLPLPKFASKSSATNIKFRKTARSSTKMRAQ